MYSLFFPLRYASFFPIPCSRPHPLDGMDMPWNRIPGWAAPPPPPPPPTFKRHKHTPVSFPHNNARIYPRQREKNNALLFARKKGGKRHTTRVYCVYEGTATLPRERKISFSAFPKMRGETQVCVHEVWKKKKKIYI